MDWVSMSWWTAERLTAAMNVVIAAAAISSFVLALRTLRLNRKININANRPMIMAEVLQPDYAQEPLRLMISNRGRSVAKDVVVGFEPDLSEVKMQSGSQEGEALHSAVDRVETIFRNRVFSTWVPGHQIDVAYWLQPSGKLVDGGTIADSAEGVPPEVFARVEYDDELGNHYSERYELNVRAVLGNDFRVSRTETNGRFNFEAQISKDLQENTRMLGRIARRL